MTEAVQLPDELSFEDWISYVFDHDDPGGHWNEDAPFWNEEQNPALALDHLARLFGEPTLLLGRFTPDQIGAGINFIASPSCSSHAFVLIEPDLPLETRLDCIRSIARLYLDLFPKICVDVHKGEAEKTMADYICFMFWDIFPMYCRTKNPYSRNEPDVKTHWEMHLAIEDVCLQTMERSLLSEHAVCQRGALHGLGHWQHGYPDRVRAIIASYLARPGFSRELIEYANQAREGMVL